ncbi:hypothetical protein HR11_01740 [Porphyromonas macacae]|uniref:Tetratricopeptide repeat n=1 Tax=Porphyromonas macacae TaxID=28115 RepID=A0A379DHS5_9PORP|nr:hypothetical protein [Porphyromonas macacae]KGO00598.1 hypothetical protein HR11_01740 [Porphyromonas macacae]SUB77702.1 Tetratricopeptide repeat [Porphyromonas macacae]
MKLKNLILAATLSVFSFSAFAQTGVQTGTPYGSGEDSIRCLNNVSLLSNNAKNKNYADAEPFWRQAYTECPGAHKNIYIYGAQILNWKISQETDSAKRMSLINELIEMYDKRVQYFGNDMRYGKDWIIAVKTNDYVRLMGKDADYKKVYQWLTPVVQELKENTSPNALYYYTFASLNIAIDDTMKKQEYINDYMLSAKYLDSQLKTATTDKQREAIQNYKDPMDDIFARSGFASCEMLLDLYKEADIEEHKADSSYLKTMTAIFQESGCESPVYYKAAKYLFDLTPSVNAAIGLAREALSNNKNAEAMGYLDKAVTMSKDAKERASCYYTMAVIKMRERNYAQARTFCNKALAENPEKGDPHILIAQMYASSASSIFPNDPVKQRCVYYLVVDRLIKARSVDPQIAARVNNLIANYSRSFPSASDVFMHPELGKGKSFFVGGWIGESTVIR